MLHRGTAPDVQVYLFRRICQPTLCKSTECMNISHKGVAQLDSTQGQLIKRSLGLLIIQTELTQWTSSLPATALVRMHALYSDGYVLSLVLPEIYVSTIFHAMYSLAMYAMAPYYRRLLAPDNHQSVLRLRNLVILNVREVRIVTWILFVCFHIMIILSNPIPKHAYWYIF